MSKRKKRGIVNSQKRGELSLEQSKKRSKLTIIVLLFE